MQLHKNAYQEHENPSPLQDDGALTASNDATGEADLTEAQVRIHRTRVPFPTISRGLVGSGGLCLPVFSCSNTPCCPLAGGGRILSDR